MKREKDKTEYDNPKIIPPEDYFHEISTPSMELDDELQCFYQMKREFKTRDR